MRRFYLAFPISHTLCDQLSWSHYRLLISVENEEARAYYLEEARKSLWSVRELQRQINSFYYERLLDEKLVYLNVMVGQRFWKHYVYTLFDNFCQAYLNFCFNK